VRLAPRHLDAGLRNRSLGKSASVSCEQVHETSVAHDSRSELHAIEGAGVARACSARAPNLNCDPRSRKTRVPAPTLPPDEGRDRRPSRAALLLTSGGCWFAGCVRRSKMRWRNARSRTVRAEGLILVAARAAGVDEGANERVWARMRQRLIGSRLRCCRARLWIIGLCFHHARTPRPITPAAVSKM